MSRFNEKCKGYENIIPFLAEEKNMKKFITIVVLLLMCLNINPVKAQRVEEEEMLQRFAVL